MAGGSRVFRVVCLIALLAPWPASAQDTDTPLSLLLVNLIQAEVRLAPPPPGFVTHEAHFVPGVDQTLIPALFNQQIVSQIASFPIGSPSGGFSFKFDAASGTFERVTNSFGPAFAERALTNGRGKFTFGANYQYSKYNSFEGQSLDSGDIKFYLEHEDVPDRIFFEGDLVQTALRLDLTSATTTLFANYGITDALDVAVAVPIVRVKMDAHIDATVLRLATGDLNIHAFPGGSTTETFSDAGEANGIGDMLLRAKYRFASQPGGGVAVGLDVRLPSGDSEELLGTGATSATITLIGSSSRGRWAPHFNIGFFATGDSDVAPLYNEFNYKVGTEFVAAQRVTLSADFVGRSLMDATRLTLTDVTHSYFSPTGVPGSSTFEEYAPKPPSGGGLFDSTLNLMSMAIGGKFNVAGQFLINANVLVALNNAGLTARFTPVIGFDYTF
jgi:hypothetical protein